MNSKYALTITACILLTIGLVAGLFSISANAVTRSTAQVGTGQETPEPDTQQISSDSGNSASDDGTKNADSAEDSKSSKSSKSSKDNKSDKSDKSDKADKSSNKSDDAENTEDSGNSKSNKNSGGLETVENTDDSRDSKSNKSETSDNATNKTTKTVTKSSSKSSSGSMTDSKGNKLLMTESQRRKRFASKSNPKRGEKPANLVPKPAVNGFAYADFGTCNSYNSENGLGGTPIYLIGTITEIEKVYENNACYGAVLLVDDCDGYQWYMRAEIDKDKYDLFKGQFTGKTGYIFGTYAGYSGVTYRPMLDAMVLIPNGELAVDMSIYRTGYVIDKALSQMAEEQNRTSQNSNSESSDNTNKNKTSERRTALTPVSDTNNSSEPYNNPEQQNTNDKFVLNTNPDRMMIHYPNCSDVPKIAAENYATTNKTIEELTREGYSTCGHCNPRD